MGGNDQLSTNDGNDELRGGEGNDYLSSAGINNILDGGDGNDDLNGAGQLYVATTGDSAHITGTGWRYTRGVGEQQLSTSEAQQCADFSARVGLPEPHKECVP